MGDVIVEKEQWERMLRDANDRKYEAEKQNTHLKQAVRTLMTIVRNSILGVWWSIGIIGTVALYFYPLPSNELQPCTFAFISIVYALLSKALYKAKEVQSGV